MQMAERLGDDAVDKKEPGDKVRPAKVGKDNNSWQEYKKRKKDKHVHEKFEPKFNNAPKGGKPKVWEARKPPKDKDACFGCGKKGHMKKDCPKVVSASTPSERLKPLLGGGSGPARHQLQFHQPRVWDTLTGAGHLITQACTSVLAPRTQSNLRFVIQVSGLPASSKETSNGFSPSLRDVPPYICFCSPLQDPTPPWGHGGCSGTLPGIPNF